MSTLSMTARGAALSPRTMARAAGAFYLFNIAAGSLAMVLGRHNELAGDVVVLIADAWYVGVVLVFLGLFRPVSRVLASLAALIGLAGCVASALRPLHLGQSPIHPLAFFGVYCILISRLIMGSTFLPRALGVLMAFGGLGWLTFGFPPITHALAPYNLIPGILAESALTVWLLVVGLNAQRWQEQAAATERNPRPA